MTEHFALDTSALIAWIQGEPGADRVDEILHSDDDVFIPWPALMEFFYLNARRRGVVVAQERYAAIKHLDVTILDGWDEQLWLQTAMFKMRYAISLADAQILALARAADAILVHKDPEYEALAGEHSFEALPFKSKRSA